MGSRQGQTQVSLWLDDDLYRALREKAEAAERTVTAEIRLALRERVEGVRPEKPLGGLGPKIPATTIPPKAEPAAKPSLIDIPPKEPWQEMRARPGETMQRFLARKIAARKEQEGEGTGS